MALGIAPQNQPGNLASSAAATMAGASSGGGLLDETKDSKTSATDPNFGEIMKRFQSQYGGKAAPAREIKKTLGKDDFLKIMITQMKNQDPTKPFDAEQMAAQMAQYASVEQLQNVNQNIQKLQSDNKTNERLSMTGMIGKTVTVDRSRFPHIQGQNESLAYTLPRDAAQVHLMIVSNTGETLLEKDLGAKKAGEQSFSWDGNKNNTLPAKNGDFFLKIVAQDSKGMTVPTNPKSQGRVIGVSFEGSDPVLLVGDAKNHQKVALSNVVQIDDVPQSPPASVNPAVLALLGAKGAGPQVGQQAAQQAGRPLAEGSQGLDLSRLSPEAQRALEAYETEAQAAQPSAPSPASGVQGRTISAAQPGAQPNANAGAELAASRPQGAEIAPPGRQGSEKGFPNGLSE